MPSPKTRKVCYVCGAVFPCKTCGGRGAKLQKAVDSFSVNGRVVVERDISPPVGRPCPDCNGTGWGKAEILMPATMSQVLSGPHSKRGTNPDDLCPACKEDSKI